MAPRLLSGWCLGCLPRVTASAPAASSEIIPCLFAAAGAGSIAGMPTASGRLVAGRRGVKYGWSTLPRRAVRPERYNARTPGLPAPTTGAAAALKRKDATTPLRTGLLAKKRGMTAFYSKKGSRIACTVLELDHVEVVANKTWERDGYWAVQVGSGVRRPVTVAAPQLGYYEARGLAPKQHLAEFRVRDGSGLLTPGVALQPDWFHVGQWVDVRSQSRGFGFAGGMKRHGFKGQEKSHGNSRNHRTIGTTGPSQGSGSRVLPGKKMPGRMGNERVTVQNLTIVQIDNELGIVLVKGAVGGPKGALVHIQDAVKKPRPSPEFIAASRARVESRSPQAAEHLAAARAQHLVLQQARREGRIAQLLAQGVSEQAVDSDATAEAAAPLPDTLPPPPPPPPTQEQPAV